MPSILWRRLDRPGHESCYLWSTGVDWRLAGTALVVDEGLPCHLVYSVACDREWRTRAATVSGQIGEGHVSVELLVAPDSTWQLDGHVIEGVAGCIDVDLNFSPSTNTLPIRRLGLEIGEEAEVRAAWLRFPSFELEPLVQRYRRLSDDTYRYESGTFSAELRVNDDGLVLSYEGFCEVEADSP